MTEDFLSPPYVNMGVCLTAILVRRRCSQPTHKQRNSSIEALYVIPQRESRGHLLAIPEVLETVILLDMAYAMGIL